MSLPSHPQVVAAFRAEFASLRSLADRAIAQVDDAALGATLDGDANSIAILMKHVGGNLRSRWTDVFTSDGEKPDRNRDAEFESTAADVRSGVQAVWDAGWHALDATLAAIPDEDLARTVIIRGETHSLVRALTRSLAHTAGHVHQIILLAKHWQGERWQTLSIARGQSEQFRQQFEARHQT